MQGQDNLFFDSEADETVEEAFNAVTLRLSTILIKRKLYFSCSQRISSGDVVPIATLSLIVHG